MAPLAVSEAEFDTLAKGLKGMHEAKQPLSGLELKTVEEIKERVLLLANVFPVADASDGTLKFASRSLSL